MRRREFISLLGNAAVAWPLAARAQQPSQSIRRLAILLHGVQGDPLWDQRLAAFRQELARFGWMAGQNLQIELRYSGGEYDRLSRLAHELVSLTTVLDAVG